MADKNKHHRRRGLEASKSHLPGGIEQAVAAAQQADIVVLAIGEAQGMSGEAQSRTEIFVPEAAAGPGGGVAKTGKPIVVVLKNGRALALEGAVANAPAILVTWFLGTETGNAIADVLFGAYSPSGRLPERASRAVSGQQPYYYAHKPPAVPIPNRKLENYKARFRGITNTALYPFGHGLTYGKIEYSDFTMSAPAIGMNGEIDGLGANYQPRPAGGGRGRPALHARSRGKHHAPGPRAEGASARSSLRPASRRSSASRCARRNLQFYGSPTSRSSSRARSTSGSRPPRRPTASAGRSS